MVAASCVTFRPRRLLAGWLLCTVAALPAVAQDPYAQPPAQAYPPTYYPPAAGGDTAVEAPSRPKFSELFAQSVARVLEDSASAATLGLSQLVVGGIREWFSRRQAARSDANSHAAGTQAQAAYGTAAPGYGTTVSPQASAGQYQDPVYYPPAAAGAAVPQDPYGQAQPWPDVADSTGVYAGIAYEVHLMMPDGQSMPVDPATHIFTTGNRFMVHFRPASPGRLDVFNINPVGRETQIDSALMAAGQLTSLGPYEFSDTKGDDWLRFVIWPCSTRELTYATRDIVNVGASAGAYVNPGGTALGHCDAVRTRSLRGLQTRDIRNVGQEGTTSFALDPVTAGELAAGTVQPREVLVRFQHH